MKIYINGQEADIIWPKIMNFITKARRVQRRAILPFIMLTKMETLHLSRHTLQNQTKIGHKSTIFIPQMMNSFWNSIPMTLMSFIRNSMRAEKKDALLNLYHFHSILFPKKMWFFHRLSAEYGVMKWQKMSW